MFRVTNARNRTFPGCLAFSLLVLLSFSGALSAQSVQKLTAEDILEIRHLIDAYPRLLDICRNNGHDYANLFTQDATFGVSSQWGGPVKIWFQGRETLRRIGGGGDSECVSRPSSGYHININPHIVPTESGASATSTLLTITNDTNSRGDIVHWEGGYEDTFEKTAEGWKFSSRVHVWEEVEWTDDPADMPPRNLEEE